MEMVITHDKKYYATLTAKRNSNYMDLPLFGYHFLFKLIGVSLVLSTQVFSYTPYTENDAGRQ